MKEYYTYSDFESDPKLFGSFKDNEMITFKCPGCNELFKRKRRNMKNPARVPTKLYCCSPKCMSLTLGSIVQVICKQCNSEFTKRSSQISKTPNNFCSKSCAATYNNTHKTTGTKRSKLEVWLEKKLTEKYGELFFDFNKKTAINSELDIYSPSLKLAFELNGIFHYEPIYSEEKLKQIQNNDGRKFQACIENGIELCIIDTSKQSYFKESTSQKYLDIICNIVDNKIAEK
jgi:DNA-binding XRE family transcriptional regulator